MRVFINEFNLVYMCAEKDRELGEALAEIRSLRNSDRLKERGVEEVHYVSLILF